jgi:hypothetical protein
MRNTILKITFFLVFIHAFGVIPAFSQNRPAVREDLWVCPVFESGFYGISNMAIGGGAALGYGNRVALGFKAVYWNDLEKAKALELNFLVRFYFFDMARTKVLGGGALAEAPSGAGPSGPFVQFSGGPVIFAWDEHSIAMPAEMSMISAGLSLGWRFLLGERLGARFFVEPVIRGGYPYFITAGLSAGVRF